MSDPLMVFTFLDDDRKAIGEAVVMGEHPSDLEVWLAECEDALYDMSLCEDQRYVGDPESPAHEGGDGQPIRSKIAPSAGSDDAKTALSQPDPDLWEHLKEQTLGLLSESDLRYAIGQSWTG